MRVLVVEDDKLIAEGLMRALQHHGHTVDCVGDGLSAELTLTTQGFDIVVMDLGLPRMDGVTVLEKMRVRGDHTPVIILTARDELDARIRGLDAGADDYIAKPFETSELVARVRAVARRAIARSGGEISAGRLRLNQAQRTFYIGNTPVDLSPREYEILEILLLRRDRVLSKAQIQEQLCNWDEELTGSAIELYMHRIRKKMTDAGIEIRTVRGFGYLLRALDADA